MRLSIRRRSVWLLGGSLAVLAVAAVVVTAVRESDRRQPVIPGATSLPTEVVQRRNLATRIEVDGLLGYADLRPVYSRSRGIVTVARPAGVIVQPGQWLYRVDDRPVVLLDGATPAWRTLAPGTRGPDVRQLQRNLAAFGFGPLEPNGVFDAGTERAVERWQRQVGIAATGTVALGSVVFQRGARRIAAAGTVGRSLSPGAPALQTSSTSRAIVISVSPEQRQYLRAGAHVAVSVPGGSTVTGTIATVARAAVAHEGGPPTFAASIAVPADAVPDLDAAPVTISIVTEQARGVTSVGIYALLALQGGGFGLEVVEGSRRRIVPVQLGAAADGFVAVSGDGIEPGVRVVTAAQ